jgi:spore germination cell wall hydrolase CwlJ-like protein
MKFLLFILLLVPISFSPSMGTIKQYDTINVKEIRCLTNLIYNEAGGEPLSVKEAVSKVVRNRVLSQNFEDSYCTVANERINGVKQFSGFREGAFLRAGKDMEKELKAWVESNIIAINTYLSREPIGPELFFNRPEKSHPKTKKFFKTLVVLYKEGKMVFYGIKENS